MFVLSPLSWLQILVNLKTINLSNSLYLTNTPDFTGIPNLESLNLEGCASLSQVHPSFGRHKKLRFVNLANCYSLTILPSILEMESLEVCTLSGCSKFDEFRDVIGNMNCLKELNFPVFLYISKTLLKKWKIFYIFLCFKLIFF